MQRKSSLSVSSQEGDGGSDSSSSLTRFKVSGVQSSQVVMPQTSPLMQDSVSRVGLSWVSVLKASGSGSGRLSGGGGIVLLKLGKLVDVVSNSSGSSVLGVYVPLKQAMSRYVNVSASDAAALGSISPTVPLVPNLTSSTVSSSPCVIGKISKDDVKEEVKYWENSVVCYVMSANPTIHVINGFVRIWKDLEINKVGMVNRGVFLVWFLRMEPQGKACDINRILFDKKPFIVKPWTSSMSYEKSSITKILIWVKLRRLNVRYWTEDTLRTIVDYLGTLIKVDNPTVTKSKMIFARVLVFQMFSVWP